MKRLLLVLAACSSPQQRPEPIETRGDRGVDAAMTPPVDAAPPRDAIATTLLPADAAPTIIVTTTDECGLVIDNIYFNSNSASIKKESQPIVDSLASMFECWIRTKEFSKFEVGGHADDREKDPLKLSDERAVAVANAFIAKGVPASAMVVVGYGKTQPMDKRKTDWARAKNRSVRFLILERKKEDDD